MKFMVIVKASNDSEAGKMPDEQMLRSMHAYNEQLFAAGVMQAGEGLHPSSRGARIRFEGDKRTVVDGPFAETKELIAGYWIWSARTSGTPSTGRRSARTPQRRLHPRIRQIFAPEDFGDLAPDVLAREEEMRREFEARQKK
jgi:hypothetical protein